MCVRDLCGHCLRGYLQSALLAAALLAVGCSGDDTSDRDDDLEDEESSAGADDDDDDDDDSDGDEPVDAGKSTVRDAGKDAGKADSGKSMLDANTEGNPAADGSAPSELQDASSDSGRVADTGSSESKMDLGKGAGKDVITIGDSWMELLAYGIQQSLVTVSGQPYRTYAFPGTRMLDEAIPNQYEAAKREDPDIKTVVMTGGGNDILQENLTDACSSLEQSCKDQLEKIAQRTQELEREMAGDGVKDLVVIGYSRGDGQYKASVEYTIETYWKTELCPEGLRCHYIDSDEIIHGMLTGDGVHPTEEGCDAIAAAVYKLMQDEGIRR